MQWLIKSEPSEWSWEDQLHHKTTAWDGVRNYQARNYMRTMQKGELAFFYHSVSEKKIVGIVEVIRTFYPDPADTTERFGLIDVRAYRSLEKPVSLAEIKSHPGLQNVPLVRQSRLSVMPIEQNAWNIILSLSKN